MSTMRNPYLEDDEWLQRQQAMIARSPQTGVQHRGVQTQPQGGGGSLPIGPAVKAMFGGGGAGAALTAGEAATMGQAAAQASQVPASLAIGSTGAPVAAGSGASAAGGGGMLAAAGPWAALAAVIAANEYGAEKAGRRGDSSGEHLRMALSGQGMTKDMQYLGDKIGGPGGQLTKIVGRLGNPDDLGRSLEKLAKPWEWF